ncbi:RNA polymerase II transcription factor B subunit 4 [Blastocladiella emersonii ATCC 22665]|nr:RNA polymerase II transcription factor B subunit 4 [Blastocladiella emersonii ATCC 22665]
MTDTENVSLLIVVLDCSAATWARHAADHASVLDQLCVFLNAYLALNHDNKLAVIGAASRSSQFLFPLPPQQLSVGGEEEHVERANAYQQFFLMNNTTIGEAKRLVQADAEATRAGDLDADAGCMLSSALSKALCYAHRVTRDAERTKTNILVISASHDNPAHYVSLMNAIFSAQKGEMTIDVCKLYSESVFLQQAAHLTHGVYRCLPHPVGAIQHMLFTFLPPPELRDTLILPASTHVDFHAACFCHRNMVTEGFVCSVCLSIYCQYQPSCDTCKTRFPTAAERASLG